MASETNVSLNVAVSYSRFDDRILMAAWVAITKYCRLGYLKNGELLSPSSGGGKLQIEYQQNWFGIQMASVSFAVSSHGLFSVTCRGREFGISSSS